MRGPEGASDLRAGLALRDARARDNAECRARAAANPGLCAALLADRQRRGFQSIDWVEYFRNLGINYP